MKFFFAAIGLLGCHVTIPTSPSDQSVYQSLVEAGCMAATDAGPSDLAAEHALYLADAGQNTALVQAVGCLYNGGTVAGCHFPCGQ